VRAEWVAAAYIGGAHTFQTSLRIESLQADLLIHPVSYAAKPFQSPIYYGYRADYFFTRHFRLEGEFTHLKVYAETGRTAQISGTVGGVPVSETAPIDSVVQQFDITHGVNLVLANFVARKSFGQRFILSGKVGGGITVPHPENEVLGVSNDQHYQLGQPAVQCGAGFEIRLWRGLYADTELRYTRVRERVDIAEGTGESLLDTIHSTAGFAWHF
jgi:hypothetical protein